MNIQHHNETAETTAPPAENPRAAGASVRFDNVQKSYDGETLVIDGLNLDILRGETLVVMGGSGCGKSTFLRMLIGSFPPTEGTITLLGHQIDQLDEEGLNEVRRKFGILFQSGALFQSMTLAQNVALPLEEHTDLDPTIIDIQVKIKLELVGLREHADKLPAQISGGMKKRAGLARALALARWPRARAARPSPVPSPPIDARASR